MTLRPVVRSNVRRDLLQSAALFANEKLVVWEYVSNSLQYVDTGVNPEVYVTVDARGKRISIEDNGRGMDLKGLQHYFTMHGENLDRLAGRRGRGRFGTGKSAAFGIARRLRVTSVRDRRRSSVELTRDAIDRSGDDEIPLEVIEAEVSCNEPNGTVVEIEEIQLPNRRVDTRSVIKYVERHLARWQGRPLVVINSYECEPKEPSVSRTLVRPVSKDFVEQLGDGELQLKVAAAPLDSEQQGVAIYANGVWLETTLAGADGQPMANHIFGEIDIPALDRDDDPMPAFDMSRSMRLNRENATVQAALAFIGREVDLLRRELVRQDRERRAAAEAKRLQHEADKIARMINEDFAEFSSRIERLRTRGGKGRDKSMVPRGGGANDLLRPAQDGHSGDPSSDAGGSRGGEGSSNDKGSDSDTLLRQNPDGSKVGTPVSESGRQRNRGGFRVEFDHLGKDEHRAKYVREERSIYVNLDHTQIRAALGNNDLNDVHFRRLAYEIAFCEYAIALASELASNQEYLDLSEPIFDIRETMNRMAVRAAAFYET